MTSPRPKKATDEKRNSAAKASPSRARGTKRTVTTKEGCSLLFTHSRSKRTLDSEKVERRKANATVKGRSAERMDMHERGQRSEQAKEKEGHNKGSLTERSKDEKKREGSRNSLKKSHSKTEKGSEKGSEANCFKEGRKPSENGTKKVDTETMKDGKGQKDGAKRQKSGVKITVTSSDEQTKKIESSDSS